MDIYVIIKRTFDTEEKIELTDGRVQTEGANYIINPYDEYAIEEAITVRDKFGGEVTVVTVGTEDAEKELRTALAMGCDKAVLIDSEELEEQDQTTTSDILAKFFEGKSFDLIIAGNVSIDNGTGQIGPRLAEKLGIAHVATIVKLDVADGGSVTAERDAEGDIEVIETALPLLVTAQQGLNEPRYPSLPGIMKAKKKPLEILELDDIDLDEDDVQPLTETAGIALPPGKSAGRILQGAIDEQAQELVKLLRTEAKII